jgi:uncharacterized protein (TIGR00725 family)
MPKRRRQIAVIGSGSCAQDSELAALAEEVGRGLAETGVVLVCGGMAGVMEAASRGAAGAGGTVIGIVPTDSAADANPHCTHVVATGIGQARNLAVVASGAAVIAVGGGWGTLAEIGFARRLGREVVTLRSWRAQGEGEMAEMPGVRAVETAAAAVGAALESRSSRRR